MSAKPKVSVVTITYNHEAYIRQALDSFLAQQTDFEFEVVVADDCSTDGTQKIIAEYAEAHPKIFRPILRQKNIGALPNSVSSLQAARGDYIALCEGDDYWTDPHKLQQQADFLDTHPGHGLTFHRVKVFTEGEPDKDLIFPTPGEPLDLTVAGLLERNFIQTNAVMYRRQDYQHIPEGIMPLDWYLHLYHAKFGKIGFTDAVMSAYRRHPGGMWWNTERDLDEIWKKHGLAHLALYEAMMGLHGDVPEHRVIIGRSIARMFQNLAGVDRKQGTDLLGQAVRRFPDGAEIFIVSQADELTAAQTAAQAAGAAAAAPAQPGSFGVKGASRELLRALKRSARARLGR